MSLEPLLAADPVIRIHAFSAMAAFGLGAVILWRRKGTPWHRALGAIWVVLMLIVAGTAFFIQEMRLIGPFSPIHLLALVTFIGLGRALWAIRVEHDIATHRAAMQALYLGSLLLAGAFTLLPGRRMHAVLFGPDAGWSPSLVVITAALLAALISYRRMRRHGA